MANVAERRMARRERRQRNGNDNGQAVEAEVQEVAEKAQSAPQSGRQRRTRGERVVVKAPTPVQEVVEEGEVEEVQPVTTVEYADEQSGWESVPFDGTFNLGQMEVGKVYTITCIGDGVYTFTVDRADYAVHKSKPRALGLVGKAYWDEVLNPDFKTWSAEWNELTYDEKVAKAKKAKVTWESHVDTKINVMRMTMAMTTALGLEKYKPEYSTKSARLALRGG